MMGRLLLKLGLVLCLAAASAAAQEPPKLPKPPKPVAGGVWVTPRAESFTTEKAIAVDPNVALKLRICEGVIRVNGWSRDEVRVFVRGGRKFEFKTLEKSAETGKPNWLWIAGTPAPGVSGPVSDCIAGDHIDIEMPTGGSIQFEARSAGTVIDSIKKATVEMVEGNLDLRNISGGIMASASRGELRVENSSGTISVETTTGSVMAADLKPWQPGDVLKIKTRSGTIAMQNVSHRLIDANSLSGVLSYDGKFLAGGVYNFRTNSGAIRMLLPQNTSCRVIATYGFGGFDSALPLKVETENDTEGGRSIVGFIGKGNEATLKLTTFSGKIGIRKQNANDLP